MAAGRPRQRTPQSLGRRLRSRLPVSPLPARWNRRAKAGALGGGAVLLAVAAAALVLLQDDERPGAARSKLDAPAPIRKSIGAMSLAQKADGVVISGFEGAAGATRLASEAQLGGLVVGADDWFGLAKGRALNARIRAAGSARGRIPPLIVARQEGGAYRAYPDLPPALGQRQIGERGDAAQTSGWAAKTGAALGGAGFDLNLAPIADVATLDSPLADRAFGDDDELVAALTAAALRGCRDSGIGCATPYFPGLGAASQSPAEGPATVGLDAASLEARDLYPFRVAIKARVPAIVISLALYSAYDPVTPAALSPSVAGSLLRDRLGFKGVAISDDLGTGAPATGLPAPRAAVQAIAAGTDMVLIDAPSQATAARAAILKAARAGSIPLARLDQALARVLALKRKLGLRD